MKKIAALMSAFLLFGLTCVGAQTELIAAAASSLTNAVQELIAMYSAVKPDIKVTPTFGSSGSLMTQIQQGAPVDVFISAAQKQMNQLLTEKLVISDSKKDLLENKVVLVVPLEKKDITSFTDAGTDKVKEIALGDPASVPAGQYAAEVFTFLSIFDTVKAKTVFAKNVRQVLAYVEQGEVDAGVVYATDAAIAKNVVIAAEAPAGSHAPVIYPAAVVSASSNQAEAAAFLSWLSSTDAGSVFIKYGFSVK